MSGSIAALHQTIKDADQLITRADPVFSAVSDTVDDIRTVVKNMDAKLVTVAENLDKTLAVTRTSIQDTNKVAEPAIESIRKAAEEAAAALRQARKTLKTVDEAMAERSPIRTELSNMLGELSAAARSIRVFADYLEQNPDALLRGKGGRGGR
jgi:paraquat-inducible protein B